jgi:hypothetical protein
MDTEEISHKNGRMISRLPAFSRCWKMRDPTDRTRLGSGLLVGAGKLGNCQVRGSQKGMVRGSMRLELEAVAALVGEGG